MGMAAPLYYTAEMVRALPEDGHRYETVHVVEVLSPTTARADRFTKRRLYQEVGIPAYWIVDADEPLVEIWTPEASLPRIERDRVEWRPAGAADSFVLSVPELFRPL